MAGSSTAEAFSRAIPAERKRLPASASGDRAFPGTAVFYFDLSSPAAYLVAERITQTLGPAVQWQPVLARELSGDRGAGPDRLDTTEIESRAASQGLMPIRWPAEFPFDSEHAMLAATYAKSIGRAVPFAQAAFRQAFAAGRSLADADNVLIAAAACEMHPNAVSRGAQLSSVAEQLSVATAVASDIGVSYVPAVQFGERVFLGESAPEQALEVVAA
jgi:2-hydroxychromene-2-carboxylate isomerase